MPKNITPNIEKERRYLIQLPLPWYGKFKVLTSENVRIYQRYLADSNDNSRVRAIMNMGNGGARPPIVYKHTKKIFISDGVNKEYEHDLTRWEYTAKLEKANPFKHRISKVRYYIDFDQRIFELDIFEERLLGLAILEIELEDMSEDVLLPPYLKVIKEITTDKYYSNVNLANIASWKNSIKNNMERTQYPRRID